MPVVLTRIDNRLIHGQVIESWLPHIKADSILVANDDVAHDSMKSALMEMSVPSGVNVKIVPMDHLGNALTGPFGRGKVLLLFAGTSDALRAHRSGVPIRELNLGNLHGGEGKVRFSCTVCLDEHDMTNLRQLEDYGVKIMAQCVPTDRGLPLERLCRCEVDAE